MEFLVNSLDTREREGGGRIKRQVDNERAHTSAKQFYDYVSIY